jgi:predicted amidohydrolase
MGGREGVDVIDIDPDRLKSIRRSLPLLNNRRSDVYQKYPMLSGSS